MLESCAARQRLRVQTTAERLQRDFDVAVSSEGGSSGTASSTSLGQMRLSCWTIGVPAARGDEPRDAKRTTEALPTRSEPSLPQLAPPVSAAGIRSRPLERRGDACGCKFNNRIRWLAVLRRARRGRPDAAWVQRVANHLARQVTGVDSVAPPVGKPTRASLPQRNLRTRQRGAASTASSTRHPTSAPHLPPRTEPFQELSPAAAIPRVPAESSGATIKFASQSAWNASLGAFVCAQAQLLKGLEIRLRRPAIHPKLLS